jgi:hypothetical protein
MDIEDGIKLFFKSLIDQQSIDFIDLQFNDLFHDKEAADSAYLADFLSEQINKTPSLAANYPELYDYYQMVINLLSFKALPILKAVAQHEMLQKRLLYAIQKGYNLDEAIKRFFEMHEQGIVANLFHSFVADLQQNSEALGTQPIELDGKRLLPQIKNWILDYSKFPSHSAKRGSIDRLNYLNQSPNVRSLTQGQRQQLSKILKAYDDFVNADNPNPSPNFGPARPELLSFLASPVSEQPYAKVPLKIISENAELGPRAPGTFAQVAQPLSVQPGFKIPSVSPASSTSQQQTQKQAQSQQLQQQPPVPRPQSVSPPQIDISKKLEDLKNRKK